ncbi:MAG: HYExAFE family protein [Planctomycetes bacterium]|jgi:hypothetical protein|nr:HYExAFE family protein [Planctomycetota bacterium]
MAGDRNHYEIAFSAFLHDAGMTALAVEERRRPTLGGLVLKHFDFLVNGSDAVWALDLKGRRGTPWLTRTDIFSMLGWQQLLRAKAQPAFVFAFCGSHARLNELDATEFITPTEHYRFTLLTLQDAQRLARPRSKRWGTLGFEWKAFTRHATALHTVLPLADVAHSPPR